MVFKPNVIQGYAIDGQRRVGFLGRDNGEEVVPCHIQYFPDVTFAVGNPIPRPVL